MTGMLNASDPELLEMLKTGSEEAFTRIYKKYWYDMYVVASRKLQDREVAEEIVQDIFARLWRERTNLRIVNLSYYLFSAVGYEVVDIIRMRGSRSQYLDYYRSFLTFENNDTENTVVYNDLIKTIDEGLTETETPEKSGEIFKLNRVEQWPVSKIAQHFKLSEKTVEYHITKVTKSIRSYLKQTIISIVLFSSDMF